MADRVQQQLLGYLLGALEETEQQQIAEQLKRDPALRRKLARVRKLTEALGKSRQRFAPPAGLAARTCQLVAQAAEKQQARPPLRLAPAFGLRPMSDVPVPPVAASGWTWLDLAVAAAILLAVSLLVFPAIEASRDRAQMAACQNNLRRIGGALAQYSHRHQDYFPQVLQPGLCASGIYYPWLVHAGYLPDARGIFCPAAPPTSDTQFGWFWLWEPVPDQTAERSPSAGALPAQRAECSFGYAESTWHRVGRNLRRPYVPVLADAFGAPPGRRGAHHAGQARNVLIEDGRVISVISGKAIPILTPDPEMQ